MAIYTTRYNRIFGKQIPTLHSPRGLGIGPTGNAGRFIRLARWAIKYRKPITGIGAVGIGAGLSLQKDGVLDASPNNFGKTRGANQRYQSNIRTTRRSRSGKGRRHTGCCHCC